MDTNRPRALTIGILLLAFIGLANIVTVGIPSDDEGPPAFII